MAAMQAREEVESRRHAVSECLWTENQLSVGYIFVTPRHLQII